MNARGQRKKNRREMEGHKVRHKVEERWRNAHFGVDSLLNVCVLQEKTVAEDLSLITCGTKDVCFV